MTTMRESRKPKNLRIRLTSTGYKIQKWTSLKIRKWPLERSSSMIPMIAKMLKEMVKKKRMRQKVKKMRKKRTRRKRTQRIRSHKN